MLLSAVLKVFDLAVGARPFFATKNARMPGVTYLSLEPNAANALIRLFGGLSVLRPSDIIADFVRSALPKTLPTRTPGP